MPLLENDLTLSLLQPRRVSNKINEGSSWSTLLNSTYTYVDVVGFP